ncbi:MAG TPA: hypothetical protein VET89_05205 [Stellaceae bacterium]|nr:hypothetical protein [Stellaceae bacterium]
MIPQRARQGVGIARSSGMMTGLQHPHLVKKLSLDEKRKYRNSYLPAPKTFGKPLKRTMLDDTIV